MRTIVEMKSDSRYPDEWKKGDRGYVDGYVVGGTGSPCACVVIKGEFYLAPLTALKAISICHQGDVVMMASRQ